MSYGKRTPQYRSLALLTGEGIVVSEGDAWRSMRRTLAPGFHRRMLTDVLQFTDDAVSQLVDEWENPARPPVVDVDQAFMRTTLGIIGRTLFGAELTDAAADTVAAVSAALDDVVRRAQSLPVPLWAPFPANLRFRSTLRQIDDAVGAMVEAHRRHSGGDGVLGPLLAAQAAGLVTTAQVRDEAVTLVVAGHETVAAAATWTVALLAGTPQIQEHVVSEGRALRAWTGESPDPPNDSLVYTTAAVEEALRLWPPVWLMTRRALADDVLCGYRIPAGTLVIVALPLLHRDPASFADPRRFRPQRFLEPQRSTIPRDAYLPFGAGPRLCIGRDLAAVEVPRLVARVLASFDVRPVVPALPKAGATIRPRGGLPCYVTTRRHGD
jgi:cytochrome P450